MEIIIVICKKLMKQMNNIVFLISFQKLKDYLSNDTPYKNWTLNCLKNINDNIKITKMMFNY